MERQKYREDDHGTQKMATNIMHDRRVVRGNTYAALVVPEDDPAELAKLREAQKRRLKKANQRYNRPGTPEPVPGRHHMDIQTDSYLEELTGAQLEFEAETQTDFLLDRPATPLYIPAKSGVDAVTQIEEGELFDFDAEVEPILEVLVGKTLERSMMEVLEDEELDAMKKHQEYFQQVREQELIEVQRMEAAEQRRQDEISRRKEQAAARKKFDDAVIRKILSRNLSRSYLSGLQQRCFEELHDAGIFHDGNLVAVEGMFMPWLLDSMKDRMQKAVRNECVIHEAIKQTIKEKTTEHNKVLAAYEDQIDEIEAAEKRVRAERDEQKRLAEMEAERIATEGDRMKLGEDEDWITTYTVVDYSEEGVLTLDDDSTDIQLPAELVETLQGRIAANAELEEKIPIVVRVNKSQKVVESILDPPEPAPVEEEVGEEAPADEGG